MQPETTIILQGGLKPMQELRRFLVGEGVRAEVVCPPDTNLNG